MKKKTPNTVKLYNAIDKLLNYSLPQNIVKLNIELEVGNEPIVTVSYYPSAAIDENSLLTNEQFKVVSIRKKK